MVMDRARYINEAIRQLRDVEVYVTLDKDPTNDMIKMVNNRVQRAHEEGSISDNTLEYL